MKEQVSHLTRAKQPNILPPLFTPEQEAQRQFMTSYGSDYREAVKPLTGYIFIDTNHGN